MNFRKASIFQRDTEKPEEQNDSGGMLAVWGSPGSGKTVTAVKIAKMLSARKKNVISMVLALRRKVNIKVRQPLQCIMVPVVDEEQKAHIEAVKNLIMNCLLYTSRCV